MKSIIMHFRNHISIRNNVILTILVLTGIGIHQIDAQVNLADPSFEVDYSHITSVTDRWIKCEGSPDKWIANQYDWMSNPDPSDGFKYLGLATASFWDSDAHESISHNLANTLFQGGNYFFDFDITYLTEMVGGSADVWLDISVV